MKIIEVVRSSNDPQLNEISRWVARQLGRVVSRRHPGGLSGASARRSRNLRYEYLGRDWLENSKLFGSLKFMFKRIPTIALGAAFYYAFDEVIGTYRQQMEWAETYLDTKDPALKWSLEQYDQFHRQTLARLCGELGTLYFTYIIAKLPIAVVSKFFGPLGSALYSAAGKPLAMLLAVDIEKDQGFAQQLGAFISTQVASGNQDLVDLFADFAVGFENKLLSLIGMERPNAKLHEPQADADQAAPSASQSSTPAPSASQSSTPAPSASQSSTGRSSRTYTTAIDRALQDLGPYTSSDWTPYDARNSKHIPTGQLFPNINIDLYKKGM